MIFKIVHGKEIHLLNSISSYGELSDGIRTAFKKLPTCFSISYADSEGDQISISNQEDYKIFQTTVKSDKPVRILIQEAQEQKIVTEIPVAQKTGFVEVIENIDQPVLLKTEESKSEVINESMISSISRQDVQALVEEEVRRIIPSLTENIIRNVSKSGSRISESSRVFEERPSADSSKVVHQHVTCDGCGVAPIVGFRYKCIICNDFDFCDKCESAGNHPHAFIKIRHPSQVPKVLIASEESDHSGMNLNGKNIDFKDLIHNPAPVIDLANQFIPGLNLTQEKVKGFCNMFKQKKNHCRGGFPNMFKSVFQGFTGFLQPQTESKSQTEPKPQEKTEQKVSEESFDGFKTMEQRNISFAVYLEQMFQKDMGLMLKFVEANPKLQKYELAEKWIEENL